MGIITGNEVEAGWFNPRSGESTTIGKFENSGIKTFDPPGDVADGNDWVLILDSVE